LHRLEALVMFSNPRSVLAAFVLNAASPLALYAEDAAPVADPAALKAFTDLVNAYRARPALTVNTTVKIELSEGDASANGSEIKGEFIFGPNRTAVIKLRGFTCYLKDGTLSAVHEATDHSYYTTPDDGSPYYTLMNAFVDIPFPELAIELGEDSIDDVLMQFHPKAPYVQPSLVGIEETEGKAVQNLKLASEHETIEMKVDPETKLIQSMELRVTGGDLVQPGTTLTYKYAYEYKAHDKPLDDSVFTFDPGQRQRVDTMLTLVPRAAPGMPGVPGAPDEGGGPAKLVGKPAPKFVLATADGKAVDLEELRGRVVVLDFWASWCGPCMQALPMLHDVAKWTQAEQLPVTVLTINVWEVRDPNANGPDARLASAKQTWQKRGFTLPVAMDYTDETAHAYGVSGIPTTVVIRADGVVHEVHVGGGANYVDDLKRDIQAALDAVQAEPQTDPHEH
jgi:thiol-disulfide isomerase/thioredoxin